MDVRRTTARWGAVVLVVTAGTVGGPALAAGAGAVDGVECGDTITEDSSLTRDLVCDGVGLTLVGGMTLDLAGHTLVGDGTGSAVRLAPGDDEDERPSTVRGGTVRDWGVGVHDSGNWRGLVVQEVTFEDVGMAIRDEDINGGGMYLTMEDSVVVGADIGLDLGWPSGGVVRGSRFEGNDIVAVGDGRLDLEDCVLVDNRVLAWVVDIGSLRLVDSDVRGNEEVVDAGWAWATVAGNTFADNGVVVAASSARRTVEGNDFRGNGLAVGARPSSWPEDPWVGPTEVVGNTFVGNHDAISAWPGADVRLGDNVVTSSTGWGIHAPGAVDLGGNRAWGNAREPQCTGVVCLGRQS
ncbi:hypothetical protein [Cellulomonas cellasea]|uniref:Right handed beta helix domain-containing protein n=2 Tax=Cellulomonas cellasea TaxID=43670 RepID=A0A0A0BAK7_9CELL|nr:hypothetical protein [Cellulomonas cellasea]KGM02874.1 hypothetical protein Q760_10965 [Cellulomonas cellasea DSM 20118]GEA87165.1 hypothetical protein CCE01nite_11140 [Cellulomonas cellasea]